MPNYSTLTYDWLSLHIFQLQYMQYQKGAILTFWKQFHNNRYHRPSAKSSLPPNFKA